MVFASICDLASSVFIFESSEHFRKYRWRAANTSSTSLIVPLAGISLLFKIGYVVLR